MAGRQGISHPEFYGDVVYKLRKILEFSIVYRYSGHLSQCSNVVVDIGSVNKPYNGPSLTNKKFQDMNFDERRWFVKQRCEELRRDKTYTQKKAVVLMDNIYQLLACENPKVGSSTLVHSLYVLHKLNEGVHKVPQPTFRNHVLLQELTPDVINIFPYVSFMFVRDPLDRLFSAYKDHRGLLNINGKLMSLEHFLADIVARKNYTLTNIHYMSYFDRCQPCDVNYQYFGEMKTYTRDLDFILKQVNISLDRIPRENARPKTDGFVNNIMAGIPAELKRGIWKRYMEDYFLFGYPKPFNETSIQ